MKNRFDNLSIALKLFIAPSITILLLLLTMPVALNSMRNLESLIATLTTTEAEKTAKMAALGGAIPEAANLSNRAVALASNSNDANAVKRLASQMIARLGEAAVLLDQLGSFELIAGEQATVSDLQAALASYTDVSRQIAGMVAADSATAYILSLNGEKFYTQLMAKLDELRDFERKRWAEARDNSLSKARGARLAMIALFAAAATISLLITTFLSRRIGGDIVSLSSATLRLANGDLDDDLAGSGRRDEIGALEKALGIFRQDAIEKKRIELEHNARGEQIRARQGIIEDHIAAFELLVSGALEAFATASEQMRAASEAMSGSAERASHDVEVVAAASGDASNNVQMVAAASQEVSASISEISRQMSNASAVTERAVAEALQTDVTVQGLSDAASRIGEVVGIISDIAGQTNLLALNATIESARAGTAGKGFAVVASEVKSLASQTTEATGEISGQIEAVQKVAREAVAAMKRIGATIEEVRSVAATIAATIEEQRAATQEITRSTAHAAARTGEVSKHIAGVSSEALTTGRRAREVQSAADALNQRSIRLRSEIYEFLAKIRAA